MKIRLQKKFSIFCIVLFILAVALPVRAENPLSATSIVPDVVHNWGLVENIKIEGSSFQDGASVTLTKEGQADIDALASFIQSER